MKVRHYAMKPMAAGDSRALALACVSSTISPWAFGSATRVQVRHTNAVLRPKGLTEGSTV